MIYQQFLIINAMAEIHLKYIQTYKYIFKVLYPHSFILYDVQM